MRCIRYLKLSLLLLAKRANHFMPPYHSYHAATQTVMPNRSPSSLRYGCVTIGHFDKKFDTLQITYEAKDLVIKSIVSQAPVQIEAPKQEWSWLKQPTGILKFNANPSTALRFSTHVMEPVTILLGDRWIIAFGPN